MGIDARDAPPSKACNGRPARWPRQSHSAMSSAEAARISTPDEAYPTLWRTSLVLMAAMRPASWPSSSGATVSCR